MATKNDKKLTCGVAGFHLANGSLPTGPVRVTAASPSFKTYIVNFMVALPGHFFYSTQIPGCLWFLVKNRSGAAKRGFRDRRHSRVAHEAAA